MSQPKTPAPRKRFDLGVLDRPDDEALDRIARVSDADKERAAALWREFAPPEFARLLDAVIREG